MTSVEWEEVKRLAADFQRAQLSSTAQRLSERNCVEIISKLLDLKHLEVVFTADGKEYVTPEHLKNEIRDELFLHGGRINLVELAQILNVDLSHIEVRAAELAHSQPNCRLILGQLIDNVYLNRIAQEINERLEQDGQITIGDLTRVYDLPSEFLKSMVEKQLGKTIHGQQDKHDPCVIFTDAYVARNRACIQGALSAVTKPTSVLVFLTQCNIPESLFFSVTENLLSSKHIEGSFSGKLNTSSFYVPTIYTKSQNEWVNHFFKQNGYLEYDALRKLGVSDPRGFVNKHFSSEKLVLLSSAAVGNVLMEQIEMTVDEAVNAGSWIDVMPNMPSVFTPEDAEQVLTEVVRRRKTNVHQKCHIFCNTVLVTEALFQNILKQLQVGVKRKAEQAVTSGEFLKTLLENKAESKPVFLEETKSDKKEDRRKRVTAGKSGGGTQGRETKTKSTKKKSRGKAVELDADDDEDASGTRQVTLNLEYMTIAEIEEFLAGEESLQDCFEELLTEIASHLYKPLNKSCHEVAQKIFEETQASSAQSRRKTHGELQDKINAMMSSVHLFEKGIKQFQNKDHQQALTKHLLKTICTEITNEIFLYIVQEKTGQYEQYKNLTPELRIKALNDVRSEAKEPLLKLHKSLNAVSTDDFLNAAEVAIGPGMCDMFIKKIDKKKEKQLLLNHRQALLEQLSSTQDPALALHLAVLILFQTATQTMLHASGRFVPNVLTFLQGHIPADTYNTFVSYQDLVMNLLARGNEDTDEDIKGKLEEQISQIKDLAIAFKKVSEKGVNRPVE